MLKVILPRCKLSQRGNKGEKEFYQKYLSAFELLKAQPPKETAPSNITTAKQVFLGYLML